MTNDYSIVQFIVRRYLPGYIDYGVGNVAVFEDEDIVGSKEEEEVTEPYVPPSTPYGEFGEIIGENPLRVTEAVTTVQYIKVIGFAPDASYSSGVEYEVEQVGWRSIFDSSEIAKMAISELDAEENANNEETKRLYKSKLNDLIQVSVVCLCRGYLSGTGSYAYYEDEPEYCIEIVGRIQEGDIIHALRPDKSNG